MLLPQCVLEAGERLLRVVRLRGCKTLATQDLLLLLQQMLALWVQLLLCEGLGVRRRLCP